MTKPTKEFWTTAYQTNIARLIGICYRYTKDYQLSEDLAHDAFLKAIEKWKSFREEGSFDAWLRRIVVNHVLQYLRDQKKLPNLQQLTPEQAEAIAANDHTAPAQPMDFTTNELLQTIDQLPEHHRLVFNLYVLEKFSHAQIGEELGISEGTSKSHLARARKKLQFLLTEKVNQQRDNNKEKAAILLFALSDDAKTDQLFTEHLEHFSIPPQKPLHINPGFSKSILNKPASMATAATAGIAVVVLTFFAVKNNRSQSANQSNGSASITALAKDSVSASKEKENVSSPTATFSKDSVNKERNKKLQAMKPLDSLALILALSTATVDASASKDSIRHQIENARLQIAPGIIDSTRPGDTLKNVPAPKLHSDYRGTFRASELVWRKDNREVEFKGEVRVDFKEQHFHGNGTFNFLGTVNLLVVDGQPVELGKSAKLADQDYYLTEMTSAEATAKFGDRGKNGAVVIDKKE